MNQRPGRHGNTRLGVQDDMFSTPDMHLNSMTDGRTSTGCSPRRHSHRDY